MLLIGAKLHFYSTEGYHVQIRNSPFVYDVPIGNLHRHGDGHETFSYSRPESGRMLMRDFACANSCYDLDVAPYNWRDPVYTTIVDVDNPVDEGTKETNNTSD